jgi:GNAT superfamily N-acetyltransferase
VRADLDQLSLLMKQSIRELHPGYYTPAQIELALANVYEIDTLLIDDGTYYVVEDGGEIVASGGWSKHAKLCAGAGFAGEADDLLDPIKDAAKIRAFFVRPSLVRRGLASLLLNICEREARAAGFVRAEIGATLSGVPFYAARGYRSLGRADVELPAGESLPVVRMERSLVSASA